MDLVDEQDVAFLEVGEDGGQVPRALDGRTARRADVGPELIGYDLGQRRLAQARGAREQDVVDDVAARLRRLDEDRQRFLDLGLAQIVAQALGAQAAVERQIVFLKLGGRRALPGIRPHAAGRAEAGGTARRLEHDTFQFHTVISHGTSGVRPSVPATRFPNVSTRILAALRYRHLPQRPSATNRPPPG